MADREHGLEQGGGVSRMMREALGVAAQRSWELDNDSSDAGLLLALNPGEIPESHTPERRALISIPEVSDKSRDQLLANLNLSPMDREKTHPEAFQYSRYKALQFRLEALAREMFSGIHDVNPEAYNTIRSILKSKADSRILDDLTIGASLAIEAYQIETGRNLLRGLAYLDKSGIDKIAKGFKSIPTNADFSLPIIDRVALRQPTQGHLALSEDVQLIGELTVERNAYNPLAMRSGAYAAFIALRNTWPEIYSPELPPYEPSHYKADSFLG